MTALQVIKSQRKIRYCDVNTRHGIIRAEFPVRQVTDPRQIRMLIRQGARENLAKIRNRR